MRELDAKQITENVAEMCKEAAYYLPKDVYEGLKRGRASEKSPVGQAVLDQMVDRDRDVLVDGTDDDDASHDELLRFGGVSRHGVDRNRGRIRTQDCTCCTCAI